MKVIVSKQAVKILLIYAFGVLGAVPTYGQESDTTSIAHLEESVNKQAPLRELKVSGYFQAQLQYGQPNATLKVGAPNTNLNKDFNRFGIRRGRLKLGYENENTATVFQVDITDKGVAIKDAYLQLKERQYSTSNFKIGIFNRPFGYEIEYSSLSRASPERARITTTLFPEERDLGAMISLQPRKNSSWHILKLDMGLFAGNGLKSDIKNKKDFIGHLSINKSVKETLILRGGVSYYRGGVYQETKNVYTFQNHSFVLDSAASNQGSYAKREYLGWDAQVEVKTKLGFTYLSGEFILGTQPGEKNSSQSPNASIVGTKDTYIRRFNGGYLSLVQDLGNLPLSTVVKYDWYHPNLKVAKEDLGLNGTGIGDLAYQNSGIGLLLKVNPNLKVTAYYEVISNQRAPNLQGYDKQVKDDVFTLRLQYKF